MYFIEHLCDLSQRENHPEYVRMMQRDILRVIDAVAPPDGSGAANVRVVRKVLLALQQKSVLLPETVAELEAVLQNRDITSEIIAEGEEGANGGGGLSGGTRGVRLDKRQIKERVEEDRERHKRLRENIWAVSGEGDAEMEKLWEEGSDVGDDDYLAAREDLEERKRTIAFG